MQPKDKVFGRIFLGHQGPIRWDMPDPGRGMSQTKALCKATFFSVISDREWPGCVQHCVYIYMHAKDLIWWADFRLQDVEKQRERRKTKAKKAERIKKKKLGNMKTPQICGGFSWPILTIKLWKIEIFDQNVPTSWGLPHIYIYIYVVELLSGPGLGFLRVIIWSKFVFF